MYLILNVAAVSRLSGLPPVMTQAAAAQKYRDVLSAAQRTVFGKALSAYMADYDLEMAKYSVATKSSNPEDWDRLARTPPPDVEYIPLSLWPNLSGVQTTKYRKLKKNLDDNLQTVKTAQKWEDFGQGIWGTVEDLGKGIKDTLGIFKYLPYIVIGGGILATVAVLKK